MLLPSNFSQVLADTFYDKTIKLLANNEVVDSEGGVSKTLSVKGTFNGNPRFETLGILQKELGLIEAIDIVITCPVSVVVDNGDLVEYLDRQYLVTNVLPFDSHKMVIGKKWLA